MKRLLLSLSLAVVMWCETATASEPAEARGEEVASEEETLELAPLASFAHDFDDPMVGGDVQLLLLVSRIYAIGLRVGGYYVMDSEAGMTGSIIVPFDLVNTWSIPVGRSRISIPIGLVAGLGVQINLNFPLPRSDAILHFALESGLRVRLTDRVGLQALIHGGFNYELYLWPLPYLGIKLGPTVTF